MKLLQLEIDAFRGATRPFALAFEPERPLTVIFGANGSGKTTIADALTCLCTDEPGSIRDKSGADASALPALGRNPADLSIRLHTDAGTFAATFSGKKLVKNPAGGQPALRVIRRQHIVELANAAPADRYKHLRAYLDVEAIEKSETALRNLLRTLQNELEREAGALAQAERSLSEAWQREGSPLGTWQDWAGEAALRDVTTDASRLETLRQTAATARSLFEAVQRHAVDRELVLQARGQFENQNKRLEEHSAQYPNADADLLRLLRQAQDYVKNHTDQADCPVCRQPVETGSLQHRLGEAIERMTALDAASRAAEDAQREKQEAEAVARRSYSDYKQQLAALRSALDHPANDSVWAPLFAHDDAEALWRANPWPALATPLARLDDQIERLDTALKQQSMIQAQWEAIGRSFRETERLYAIIQATEATFAIVETERKAYIEQELEAVASDINALYALLHPGEAIGDIRLFLRDRVKGSLDLSASFHHHSVTPQAVYSESHLDTMALCIFLALARKYGGSDCILLLDDVVMSSDHLHLQHFIKMLRQQAGRFAHIIVTTHYQPWRDELRNGPNNDDLQLVLLGPWSMEGGIQLLNDE